MVRHPPRARRNVTDSAPAPLIVTARLPGELQSWMTGLRARHFPPERNFLDAHVTLFHALPPSSVDEVRRLLARLTADFRAPPAILCGVMSLGRGTAFHIDSPDLQEIRGTIAARFHGALSAQDNHVPRLHVTVQNKVTSAEARALQAQLAEGFVPRDFSFTGLALHAYRGGPWEALGQWSFRGGSARS